MKLSLLNSWDDVIKADGLTVIYHTHNCILAKGKDGKAHYIYRLNSDTIINCSLLSEISQSKVKSFLWMLKRCKLTVVPVETETDYFEVLTDKIKQKFVDDNNLIVKSHIHPYDKTERLFHTGKPGVYYYCSIEALFIRLKYTQKI